MCTIIYGQFSAKATAKDITKHLSPRKPKLCARKNRESRRESLWGLEPNRYPVFDAAHLDTNNNEGFKQQWLDIYIYGICSDVDVLLGILWIYIYGNQQILGCIYHIYKYILIYYRTHWVLILDMGIICTAIEPFEVIPFCWLAIGSGAILPGNWNMKKPI